MQVKRVRCESSGVLVPKDKAIKRFIVRNIVDASAIRDIQDSSIIEGQRSFPQVCVCRVMYSDMGQRGRLACSLGDFSSHDVCYLTQNISCRLRSAQDLQKGLLQCLSSHPLQGGQSEVSQGPQKQSPTSTIQAWR